MNTIDQVVRGFEDLSSKVNVMNASGLDEGCAYTPTQFTDPWNLDTASFGRPMAQAAQNVSVTRSRLVERLYNIGYFLGATRNNVQALDNGSVDQISQLLSAAQKTADARFPVK